MCEHVDKQEVWVLRVGMHGHQGVVSILVKVLGFPVSSFSVILQLLFFVRYAHMHGSESPLLFASVVVLHSLVVVLHLVRCTLNQ